MELLFRSSSKKGLSAKTTYVVLLLLFALLLTNNKAQAQTSDFGDANKVGNASIVAGSSLKLGIEADTEFAGQENATATGDDTLPAGDPDDEDGVVTWPTMKPGISTTVVLNMTGNTVAGFLNLYIDFNNDGIFGAGERAITNQAVASGAVTASLVFTPPSTTVVGVPLTTRVVISSVSSTITDGVGTFAGVGEIEDYMNTFVASLDYGDASQVGQAWILADNVAGGKLGASVDNEATATLNSTATGDDNTGIDDENGIATWPAALQYGVSTNVTFAFSGISTGHFLNVWIDADADGVFQANERYVTDNAIAIGTTVKNIAIAPIIKDGAKGGIPLAARVILTNSSNSFTSAVGALAGVGEIEDYMVTIKTSFDYGDASAVAEAMIPTLTGLRLGALDPDTENNSTFRNATATGDDTGGTDDEDAFSTLPAFVAGQTTNVTIPVAVPAGTTAAVGLLVDFNNNGAFELSEYFYKNSIAAGTTSTGAIAVPVPLTAQTGVPLTMRATIVNDPNFYTTTYQTGSVNGSCAAGYWEYFENGSSSACLCWTGGAPFPIYSFGPYSGYINRLVCTSYNQVPVYTTYYLWFDGASLPYFGGIGATYAKTQELMRGEIEDYMVTLPAVFDYGDANTVNMQRIQQSVAYGLGATGDAENAPLTNNAASGDGADDDAVATWPALVPNVAVTVPITFASSASVRKLNVWIDFNSNGQLDASERLATNVSIAAAATTYSLSFTVPVAASVGNTVVARFITSNTDLAPGADAAALNIETLFGEIEDYMVTIPQPIYDFGDDDGIAGATTYSLVDQNLKIGWLVDAEQIGSHNATALSDDALTSDDEDGITAFPPLRAGATVPINLYVQNNTTATARLNAWIDFNNNGSLADAGEQVAVNTSVAAGFVGYKTINVAVPAGVNTTAAFPGRFRLNTASGAPATGVFGTGEVEDHLFVGVAAAADLDYGDNSKVQQAWAITSATVRLGSATTDGEVTPVTNTTSTGDDTNGTDDEDGIATFPVFYRGGVGTVIATKTGAASDFLNAWVDFNNDGDFEDANEYVVQNKDVTSANFTFNIAIPGSAVTYTNLALRLRLSDTAPSISLGTTTLPLGGFVGTAGIGEIEDYVITVVDPTADFSDYSLADPASSIVDLKLRMGTLVDVEAGVSGANATATGDDATNIGIDDEDGIAGYPFIPGSTMQIPVRFSNEKSYTAYFNAWADFNRNNIFGDVPNELIAVDTAVPAGTMGNIDMIVDVPASLATDLDIPVRLRLTKDPGAPATGSFSTGEVEDYLIITKTVNLEYGDNSKVAWAASTYSATVFLGAAAADNEWTPTINTTADGDDTNGSDDEDVDVQSWNLAQGAVSAVTIPKSAGTNYIHVWIDFNNNGSFGDAGEHVLSNSTTSANNITVPATAVTGQPLPVRIRLTTTTGAGPEGFFGTGEVEDHLYIIQTPTKDFGDWNATNAASALVDPNLKLGTQIDTELSGLPYGLNGDDNNNLDDEDGLNVYSMLSGTSNNVQIVVSNKTTAAAFVNLWIDLDNNGAFGSGEQLVTNLSVAAGFEGGTIVSLAIPASAVTSADVAARLRINTASGAPAIGDFGTGEVEDYPIRFSPVSGSSSDYGDDVTLPVASSIILDGATKIRLGGSVDAESTAQTNSTATGDDLNGTDDENGIASFPAMVPGGSMPVNILTSGNTATGFLSAWVDFNKDGDLLDAGEQVLTAVSIPSTATSTPVIITIPPAVAVGVTLSLRLRFTQGALTTSAGASGAIESGEVEDYQFVTAAPTRDFGDFGATQSASHLADVNKLVLGKYVDLDPPILGTNTADADDFNASDDDEESLVPTMVAGSVRTIAITTTNFTGAAAYVNVWMDLNSNGIFDATEQLVTNYSVANNSDHVVTQLSVTIPAVGTAVVLSSNMGVRIRLSARTGETATGDSPALGEVEDFAVPLVSDIYDFGDLPDPTAGIGEQDYQSTNANGGPRHLVVPGFYLGDIADTEADAISNITGTGDIAGTDDDEGVIFPILEAGKAISIGVKLTNTPNFATPKLNAWIDWNADGDFVDVGERIATNLILASGANTLNLTIPATAKGNVPVGARFRLSTDDLVTPNGATPIPNGEVEDYIVMIAELCAPDAPPRVAGGNNSFEFSYTNNNYFNSSRQFAGTGVTDIRADPVGVSWYYHRYEYPDAIIGALPIAGWNWNRSTNFNALKLVNLHHGFVGATGTGYYNSILEADRPTAGATATSLTNRGYGVNTDHLFIGAGDGNVLTTRVDCLVPGHIYQLCFEQANGSIWYNYSYPTPPPLPPPPPPPPAMCDPYFNIRYNGGWKVQLQGNPTQTFMNTNPLINASHSAGTAPFKAGTNNDNTLSTGFDWDKFKPGWERTVMTFTATAPVMTISFTAVAASNPDPTAAAYTAHENRLNTTGGGAEFKSYSYLDNVTVKLVGGCDFGDLPDIASGTGPGDYKTLATDFGAGHVIVPNLKLGSVIDSEGTGQPDLNATGDDRSLSPDDEDALAPVTFVAGVTATLSIKATNKTGLPAYMTVFVDLNNNGSLEDAGEKVGVDILVANNTDNGTFTATVPVPATATGNMAVRIRLSNSTGLTSFGMAKTGEVEDYMVPVAAAASYDLALTKKLASIQPRSVAPGQNVTFEIQVTNQGAVAANNIVITDYIQTGFTWPTNAALNPGWTNAGSSSTRTITGPIAAGGTSSIFVTLTVDAAATGTINNFAEISTDDGNDIDSTPDGDNTNDGPLKDDEINNVDADQDDHDIESVTVAPPNTFDLALRKKLSTGQSVTVNPGDEVSFEIEVFNQGTVAATNVVVTDYIQPGLKWPTDASKNPSWVAGANASQKNYTIAGPIAVGGSSKVTVKLVVDPNLSSAITSVFNYAEISNDNHPTGNVDVDSEPDATFGNDANRKNDEINQIMSTGDEDDEDEEGVSVVPIVKYDLALRKTLSADQTAVVSAGDDVTFDIYIFNQGTVAASNIVITDYIRPGFTWPTDATKNPGWTGSGSSRTYTFAGPISANGSGVITVKLKSDPNARGLVDNFAEISTDDGNDLDSTPDAIFGNDGTITDDAILNESSDEDDMDVAQVTLIGQDVFDFALDKKLASGQAAFVAAGSTVNFSITVYKQGTKDATNLSVVDYIDAAKFAWPSSPTVGWSTPANDKTSYLLSVTQLSTLNTAGQITIPISLTLQAAASGTATNVAEIGNASGGTDVDSTPDTDNTNDGTPVDNVITENRRADATKDEDDHDPASVTIGACPMPAITAVTATPNPVQVSLTTSFDVTATNTDANTVYAWAGPNTFTSAIKAPSNVTVSSTAGTYTYTVTVSNGNSCSVTSTLSLTVTPPPCTVVNISTITGTPNPINPSTAVQLDVTANASGTPILAYAWAGPSPFTSAIKNPTTTSSSTVGNSVYSVTITNTNGPGTCTASAVLTLTVAVLPCTPITGVVITAPTTAAAGTSISLDVSATAAGTPVYTYSWAGPNSFTSTVKAPSATAPNTAGAAIYTVTVKNADGTGTCTATQTVSIDILIVPCTAITSLAVSITPNPVDVNAALALDVTATSTGTPLYQYAWTGPSAFTSTVKAPSTTAPSTAGTATYTVKVTNANGTGTCTATATATVDVKAIPCTAITSAPITVTPASGILTGETFTLDVNPVATGTPVYVYSWTGSNTFTSAVKNPTVTAPSTAGTLNYTVTVTNNNGTGVCTATNTVSVLITLGPCTPLGALTLTATPNSLQTSGSTSLNVTGTGVSAASIFAWTGSAGSPTFTSTVQNPTVTGFTAVNGYTYTVSVSNTGGTGVCTATGTVSINVANPCTNIVALTATATPTGVAINGSSSLSSGATSGIIAGVTTFSWSSSNGFTSTAQNPPSTGTLASLGTYSYTVTATNANGTGVCTATATTTVLVSTPCSTVGTPVANVSVPNLASGSSATLDVNSSGIISGTSTYSWTGTGGFTSTAKNPSTGTLATAGNYLYTVLITNPNGIGTCTATATTSLGVCTALSGVTATAGSASVSSGTSTTLNVTGTGISGTSTITWSSSNGFSSSAQNPSTGNLNTIGTYTYTVTVNNGLVCSSTASVSITVTCPNLVTPVVNDKSLCGAAGIVFDMPSACNATSSLKIYSNSGLTTDVTSSFTVGANTLTLANLATTTTYYAVCQDNNNVSCKSVSDTFIGNVYPIITPVAGGNSVCEGQAINLTASGGTNYAWTGPSGFTSAQQNPSIATSVVANTGTYQVTIMGAGGCSATSTVAVVVTAMPSGTIIVEQVTCNGNLSRDDAKLRITSPVNVTKLGYSLGGTYTGPAFSAASNVPVGGDILTNIANPTTATSYTIRVFNTVSCFTDYTVLLQPKACVCPDVKCLDIQSTRIR